MSIRIQHPRPVAGRQSAFQVEFVDGFAVVESLHPERELALKQHGFTVIHPEDEKPTRKRKAR